MTKEKYKKFFNKTKSFIKYSFVCKECGINPSNLSQFLNGTNDYALSIDKCEEIYKTINVLIKKSFA